MTDDTTPLNTTPLNRIKFQQADDDEAIALLREWIKWWDEDDEAPPKMPDALHIRTATFLLQHQLLREEIFHARGE